MKNNIDLLHGPVTASLTRLAIPIMATSLIQMAYNLTDMIWIGRLGSQAVAAVGAAGMYMWRNWDAETVRKDLETLSRYGMTVLRVFPLWPDFQPIRRLYGGGGCRQGIGNDRLFSSAEERRGRASTKAS